MSDVAAIREAVAAVLAEPADARARIAAKLHALSEAIGDRDHVRASGIRDTAEFLARGTFIPTGASVD